TQVRAERVRRADELRPNGATASDDDMDLAARSFPFLVLPGRVVGEHSLRATEVGNAHGRELHAAEFLRRKGDGDPYDAVENPVFAQDAPERLALAQQAHVGPTQGELVLSQAER